ncbi:DNA breaking-rejoining protein [Prevotella aurantiaca]|uniref:DNA breaking-rejoining protein n=1 Tax=Prevotella aurantiaca TaxID=596085 RepID=UPI0028ED6955|nr:DNA breaking-rejoining protein [Prevotella aurantiaca]
MNEYIIQKSIRPNKWVLTDKENGVIITFEEGNFNNSQKVTMLEDAPKLSPIDLARIVRKLGEWGARHHGSKLFKNVYGFEYSEDNKHLYLYRKNPPRWRMELENDVEDTRKLASTLNKAAEFLTKRDKNK